MKNVTMSQVKSGAALLKKLLAKADNGDGTLTVRELQAAVNPAKGKPVDGLTQATLVDAVNKMKVTSERTVKGIQKAVDDVFKEIKKGDVDGSSSISPEEVKKLKTKLAKSLVEFSGTHGRKSASSFNIVPHVEDVYVPTRPFRAPKNASSAHYVDSLVQHFNSWANDNSKHGRRPESITRYVLGVDETKAVAKEIAKLAPAKAKAALRELAKRIAGKDGAMPLYVDPKGQTVLNRVAKDFGVTANFKGNPRAPQFDYY